MFTQRQHGRGSVSCHTDAEIETGDVEANVVPWWRLARRR
jgi:hypothetical protein